MTGQPRIELLVIQPTPFCNIACRYCYLPNRNDKSVISTETIERLFTQIFASGWIDGALSVVWHAGEPLVLPVGFYDAAFRLIARLKPSEIEVHHAFQTNGMLIDEAWCNLFSSWQVDVGVSIDGPKHLHDRARVTRSGRGTFDRTIAGVRLLRRRRVPFHVISVLTTASLASPQEMFDFYVAEGIEAVCFNVEETDGSHVSRTFMDGGVDTAYYRFLHEFWRLCAAAPGRLTFVREIEHALEQVVRPKDGPLANQLTEPFAIVSVDWSGNISTFSPELLGVQSREYDDFILGNINRDELVDLQDRPVLARMLADIREGVRMCHDGCEYFSVCGGGEPANKLAENGTFASSETTYCRVTKMRPTDLVLDAMEHVRPAPLTREPLNFGDHNG